jgi:hypothetical protein
VSRYKAKSTTKSWIAAAITGTLLAGVITFATPATSAPADCPAGGLPVSNQTDLSNIRNGLTGIYCLTQDITLTGPWTPIGTNTSDATKFSGKLYGDGHEIIGLSITNPAGGFIGLFGSIKGATIDGVTLRDVDIQLTSGTEFNVGTLVAFAENSTLSNLNAAGTLTVDRQSRVGGLVAGLSGNSSLTDSSAAVNVTQSSLDTNGLVGGLVGQMLITSSISRSSATGNVIGYGSVGGLVGVKGNASTISASYATGTVSGSNSTGTGASRARAEVGGLVGEQEQGGSIESSYATGAVSASDETEGRVGGLVGSVVAGIIRTSYATGAVSGSARLTGGFAGSVHGSTNAASVVVQTSYATGAVTSTNTTGDVGGFAGRLENGTIKDVFATGRTDCDTCTGFYRVGGLVGYMHDNTVVQDSYSLGLATGYRNPVAPFTATGLAGGSIGQRRVGAPGTPTTSVVTSVFTDSSVNGLSQNQFETDDPGRGTGLAVPTATLQSFAHFTTSPVNWSIQNGFQSISAFSDPTTSKPWGICDGLDYPFLRWTQTTNPCPGGGAGDDGSGDPPNGGTPNNNDNPPSPPLGGGTTSESTGSSSVITSGDKGSGVAGKRSVVYRTTAVVEVNRKMVFAINPAVPGFRINASTGAVRMTKSVPAGTYTLTITATDGVRSGTRTVTITVAATRGDRLVVSGFALNSKVLTPSMRKVASEFLKTRPAFASVTCKGFTSLPAARTDARLSIERATALCRYIKSLRPDITTRVIEGQHIQKPGPTNRKVRAVFR